MSTFVIPYSPTSGYGMNVPGWLEGHNDPSAVNASGTVCIMDTGIDVTHPDLQGVLYNFEENQPAERYAELQAKYGLGPYGINTTGDTTPDDVTSYDAHGVHVAGIVAAQWDGAGTSGVANGVSQSPYCVTVDAASPSGQLTDFSCYGQTSTDVLAPGAQILAPVTQEIVKGYGDEVTSRSILKRFFPEATNPVNILALDSFDATPQVRFFDDNPVTNPDAKELEVGRNESVGFTDRTCASINISSLNKEQRSSARPAGVNGYLYLAIPVASVANAKWVGLYQAVSDGFMADAQLESIVCAGEDGTPMEVSAIAPRQLKTGWDASTYSSVYRCQWTNISFNIDEIIAASNRLHDDPTLIDGAANYVDPGKATGVYGWDRDGKTYVIV